MMDLAMNAKPMRVAWSVLSGQKLVVVWEDLFFCNSSENTFQRDSSLGFVTLEVDDNSMQLPFVKFLFVGCLKLMVMMCVGSNCVRVEVRCVMSLAACHSCSPYW